MGALRLSEVSRELIESLSTQEPNTGCWLWKHTLINGKGYGVMRVDGRLQPAHRVAWSVIRGPIPDGLHVLHRCDTPACVNADTHLWLGTQRDNMLDKESKGRGNHAVGERHGLSKLTADMVALAREMRLDGEKNAVIARALGVHPSVISKAVRGKTWAHVTEAA